MYNPSDMGLIRQNTKHPRSLERRVRQLEEKVATQQEELDALAAAIEAAVSNISTEVASLKKEVEGLKGGAALDFTGIEKAVSDLEAIETPAPAPATPEPTAPTPVKPLYEHEGSEPVDLSVWPESGFETKTEPPIQLHYFADDEAGGVATGVEAGVWSEYTGEVQADPTTVAAAEDAARAAV